MSGFKAKMQQIRLPHTSLAHAPAVFKRPTFKGKEGKYGGDRKRKEGKGEEKVRVGKRVKMEEREGWGEEGTEEMSPYCYGIEKQIYVSIVSLIFSLILQIYTN